MNRPNGERAAAVVELALYLPLMVFLAATAVTGVRMVLTYSHLTDVSKAGARYATRAALDPTTPGDYRFRPTEQEVAAYVNGISEVPVSLVSVSPDPATSHPGTRITVRVTSRLEVGPLGRAAGALVNAFAGLLGSEPPFPPEGLDLSSTAVMREE